MKRPIAYDPRAALHQYSCGPSFSGPLTRNSPSLPEIAAVAIGAALIVLMLF